MTTMAFRESGDAERVVPVCVQRGLSGLRGEALGYFLRRWEVFAGLPERDLRELADAAVLRSLPKGAYLFHRDEGASGLYFVRRGIINFHRVAADGREIVLHFYREGELLAEIDGCPADARAVQPSEVIVIPRRCLLAVLRRSPELALRLFAALSVQVHQMADSLEDMASRSAGGRFAQWLLRQCEGDSPSEAVEIQLGTTKRALAGELGVRQETLSRMLRQLTEAGHLRVNGRRITVRNPAALRDAARLAEV
jgi:CRP/FNR family transcriptional regulator